MSNFRYKQTENEFDDNIPLPMHMEESDDTVEMQVVAGDDDQEQPEITGFNIPFPPEKSQRSYKKRRTEVCFLVWAILATLSFAIVLAFAIWGRPERNLKWCCIGDDEMEECKSMANAFKLEGLVPELECKQATSSNECIDMIDTDIADVFTISNSQLYKYRNILQPIMTENYESDGFGYYLVAVVKVEDNSTKIATDSLRGKAVCIKDLELTAGYLHNKSFISTDDTCNVKGEVTKLFSSTCAPNSSPCNDCPGKKCASSLSETIDIMKTCLFEDSTSITFIDHISLKKIIETSGDFHEKYRLLCPDGTYGNIKDVGKCNLLWEPSNALVVSSKMRSMVDINVPMDIVELLASAQIYFGYHTTTKFNMFKDKSGSSLLFQSGTRKLVPLTFNCTTEGYLEQDFMKYRLSYDCLATSKDFSSCMLPQYQ